MRRALRLAYFSLLVLEAIFSLIIAAAKVRFIPFRRYSRTLREKTGAATPPQLLARDIRRVIDWLSPVLWERSRCLICAIAARSMLTRRGFRSELSLGIDPDQTPMVAHAWLVAASVIVTGHGQRRHFKEVVRL
jgi:hypothetical protein